jgi:hypothetical protein
MHTCVSVYVCVYEERERISVTLVTTAAQGCPSHLYMCASACVFRHYSANLTTSSVCLPVHTVTQKKNTHTQDTRKTQTNTCPVMIENPSFVLKRGNTIAHPHKHTHQGTHCICGMPWKASGGTDVMPLRESSSVPASVGQEPVRTSGAPA